MSRRTCRSILERTRKENCEQDDSHPCREKLKDTASISLVALCPYSTPLRVIHSCASREELSARAQKSKANKQTHLLRGRSIPLASGSSATDGGESTGQLGGADVVEEKDRDEEDEEKAEAGEEEEDKVAGVRERRRN
jgi:hypothetical protein